ncbi:MAG: hypothetical protein [Bacteriophage sp.]|nr:MAG: hypothetical protein [Bacteriophage sp.]
MKPNGCNEDGWDLFEESTRKIFEEYAYRRGYSIVRDSEYSFFYADPRTEEAWEMYHRGHVKGRTWNDNPTIPN